MTIERLLVSVEASIIHSQAMIREPMQAAHERIRVAQSLKKSYHEGRVDALTTIKSALARLIQEERTASEIGPGHPDYRHKTPSCVICNKSITKADSGLCDDHKYDEQPRTANPPF
jgi:hypothetical protein